VTEWTHAPGAPSGECVAGVEAAEQGPVRRLRPAGGPAAASEKRREPAALDRRIPIIHVPCPSPRAARAPSPLAWTPPPSGLSINYSLLPRRPRALSAADPAGRAALPSRSLVVQKENRFGWFSLSLADEAAWNGERRLAGSTGASPQLARYKRIRVTSGWTVTSPSPEGRSFIEQQERYKGRAMLASRTPSPPAWRFAAARFCPPEEPKPLAVAALGIRGFIETCSSALESDV
jgi:hypothetical protein